MNNRILERIALHADIDTRRALGIYNKIKVPCLEVGHPCIWRYYPDLHKAIYFNADPEDYEFEIHEGMTFDGEYWSYTDTWARVRTTWKHRNGRYVYRDLPAKLGIRFALAQNPEFIIG